MGDPEPADPMETVFAMIEAGFVARQAVADRVEAEWREAAKTDPHLVIVRGALDEAPDQQQEVERLRAMAGEQLERLLKRQASEGARARVQAEIDRRTAEPADPKPTLGAIREAQGHEKRPALALAHATAPTTNENRADYTSDTGWLDAEADERPWYIDPRLIFNASRSKASGTETTAKSGLAQIWGLPLLTWAFGLAYWRCRKASGPNPERIVAVPLRIEPAGYSPARLGAPRHRRPARRRHLPPIQPDLPLPLPHRPHQTPPSSKCCDDRLNPLNPPDHRPHIAPDRSSHIPLGLTRRDTPLQLLAILGTQPPAVLPSTSLSHHDLLSVTASLPAAEATTTLASEAHPIAELTTSMDRTPTRPATTNPATTMDRNDTTLTHQAQEKVETSTGPTTGSLSVASTLISALTLGCVVSRMWTRSTAESIPSSIQTSQIECHFCIAWSNK